VPSFIGAKPETRATALKKHVASAFAPGHVLAYEDIVNDTMEILIQQLEKHGPVVEMVEWLRYFMFDTLSRIAFSEDFGFMARREDIDGTLASARQRFDHWHYWLAVPRLERLIFKNPIVLQFTKSSSRLAALALRKIEARKQQGKKTGEFRDLLSHYLQAGEKDPEVIDSMTVIGLTISTIHAGADTTAAATSMFFEHILRHPVKLAKLEDELATAPLSQPPTFTELNKLPYLDACIKESMRLRTISGDMLERVVGSSGAEIAGSWVPGGTVVTVSSHVVNRDESIWGSCTEMYNPDRWTEADEAHRRRMERSLIAFSAGKRICLGQHIAWLEMKKLIPRLLTTYKASPANRPGSKSKLPKFDIPSFANLPSFVVDFPRFSRDADTVPHGDGFYTERAPRKATAQGKLRVMPRTVSVAI
jgi:cytochrome P450